MDNNQRNQQPYTPNPSDPYSQDPYQNQNQDPYNQNQNQIPDPYNQNQIPDPYAQNPTPDPYQQTPDPYAQDQQPYNPEPFAPEQQYSSQSSFGGPQPPANGSKTMAILSLIFGIVSICCCCLSVSLYFAIIPVGLGIAGLILGILGRKKNPAASGMALAGIILSSIGLLLSAVMIVTMLVSGAYLQGFSDFEELYDYYYYNYY